MIPVEYKEITTFIIFQRRNLKFHANAPLNGEVHPLVDGKFEENPANGGNGSRLAKPDKNDW
jgi:hypothetical protein